MLVIIKVTRVINTVKQYKYLLGFNQHNGMILSITGIRLQLYLGYLLRSPYFAQAESSKQASVGLEDGTLGKVVDGKVELVQLATEAQVNCVK